MDEQGIVIARAPEPHRWVARSLLDRPLVQTMFREKTGQMEAKSIDGINRMIGYTKTNRAPWLVYVGIPSEVALAPAQTHCSGCGGLRR